MITIIQGKTEGTALQDLRYIRRRRGIGKIILPVTRYLRAKNAGKYIGEGDRLLDIGCGDGYFLRTQPCRERYGLDKLLGDEISDSLPFPDACFDYVTMLAVLEHMNNPDILFAEIHRVLKPGGRFVFTTPKKQAECLIRLYAKNMKEEHQSYFTVERVKDLAGEWFAVEAHHTFILGLNQAFCLRKKP